MRLVRSCLVVTAFLLVLCCAAYPALVTAVAHAAFSHEANGSLIERDGRVWGSTLIGQSLASPEAHPEYFWGRPSSASVDGPTGVVVSAGSNLGPLNPALADAVAARVATLRATGVTGPVPVDLVTASASGLDPHLSPAAVRVQIPRVARARRVPEAELRALVASYTDPPTLGVLGAHRVRVLELNLALDARFGK